MRAADDLRDFYKDAARDAADGAGRPFLVVHDGPLYHVYDEADYDELRVQGNIIFRAEPGVTL